MDYTKAINELKVQVNVLQNRSDSLANALKITNANISSVTKTVDSIKSQLALINTQLNQLNAQLTTINANIVVITAQIAELNKQYASLLAQLTSILNQLSGGVPATLNNGLLLYFPFSGNAGDSSGNGYNGIVNGASLTMDRFGQANRAYYFNYYDEIATTFKTISGTQSRTFSFWMKNSNSNKTISPIWYTTNNASYSGDVFNIRMNRNEQHDPCNCWPTTYEGVGIDGDWVNLIYKAVVGDNKWHHYVYVSNANGKFKEIQIYQDGILISITSNIIFDYNNNSGSIVNTISNATLSIGKSMASQTVPSSLLDRAPSEYLDDIRIHNRALTQSEITYLASH